MELNKKVIIITGSSSGVDSTAKLVFAKEGASVEISVIASRK